MLSSQLKQTAKRLFPIAVLYLGNREEAKDAVTEVISADEKISDADGLRHLLRIAGIRAKERLSSDDAAEDDALKPVFRLTAAGRRDIALHLSDFQQDEILEILGITAEEYRQKIEKVLRQLTFINNGEAPETERMQNSFGRIVWDEQELKNRLSSVNLRKPAKENKAVRHEISHKVNAEKTGVKTVTIPLRNLIFGSVFLAVLLTGIVVFTLHMTKSSESGDHPGLQDSEECIENGYAIQYLQNDYLTIEQVQQLAADSLQRDQSRFVFYSTKLKNSADPPVYELDILDEEGQEYLLKLHAEKGTVLDSQQFAADHAIEMTGSLPLSVLRRSALDMTGLDSAAFLKEKLSEEGEVKLCKFELADSEGIIYNIHLNAESGALVKYSLADSQAVERKDAISIEEAKQKALSRIGDYRADQVIFTKEKFEGSVYSIALTLDDGTQYAIELNAKDGKVNTVDVHPASADTSNAIGLLRSRDIVLEKAGIPAQNREKIHFTKAKIDRNNGVYVYELDFSAPDFEYEVCLEIESGRLIKYRAWPLL